MHGKRRILEKKRSLIIKYTPASERNLSLFRTPYEQHLLPDNPWVQMEAIVPWDELAKIFFKSMSSDKGRASVDLRIVIGAMLVKHLEGLSDEDTIRYIQENIYVQFFVVAYLSSRARICAVSVCRNTQTPWTRRVYALQ